MIGTDTYSDPIADMATAGVDPVSAQDPLLRQVLKGQMEAGQSQPVPGITHGSIPGLLGIALNGGAGGSAFSGGMWRPSPGASFPDAPAVAPASNAAPAASGIPLPQPRPASAPSLASAPGADAMAAAPLPATASPATAPGAPPPDRSLIPPDSMLGRLFSNIGNFRDQNRLTLLALAGGLAGSQNFGTGLSRGFQAALPAQMQDIQLNRMNQTAQALISRGLPPDLANVAAQNPAVLQQMLPRLFGVKQQQFTQIGEDMFGNKRYGFVDPVSGAVTPFEGSSPFGGGGSSGAVPGAPAGPGAPAPNSMPGTVNSNLVGEDYLKQFPPEMQAAVKAYVGGESMPTGNPRAGFTQAVKMIAQKYGNDIGVPADDTTFNARRTMRTQLSSAAPNSLGGQINTGNTAIGHLADLSDAALALNNSGGWGFAPLAHVINNVRGLTTDQAAKVQALQDAAQHYGQEITKFYAGSPGGEAERNRFMDSISAAKSPTELAAVIAQERQLMESRLGSIGSQIKGTLGPAAEQYPVVRPESATAFGKIDGNVTRLRGGQGPQAPALQPAPAQAAPVRITDKAAYDALPKGTPYIAPDGTPRIKQ